MATRIRIFLLKLIIASSVTTISLQSQVVAEEVKAPLNVQTEQLIQPEIQRREVKLATIDNENFEASAFIGILSLEDFGSNPVIGARLAYHINEDLFVEGAIGLSEAGESLYERYSGGPTLLSTNDKEVLYYNVSLGFNLLPGEVFLTQNTSFNTALYIIGGVGNTEFAGNDLLTINIGGGFRLLANDWLSLHIDVRDHIFELDILNKKSNNLEVTFGISAFF